MFNDIRLHLSDNDEQQEALEIELGNQITKTQRANLHAFQRLAPQAKPETFLTAPPTSSVFANKLGNVNITNFMDGTALYGLHPAEEVSAHLHAALAKMPTFSFTSATSTLAQCSMSDITAQYDQQACLVIVGCGLGYHILELIERYPFKHVILYEPNSSYFSCSVMACDWQRVLNTAQQKSINIYFQIGNSGQSFVTDAKELRSHFDVSRFYLYQHLNSPTFEPFNTYFESSATVNLQDIELRAPGYSYLEYVNEWTPPQQIERTVSDEMRELFDRNMAGFKLHFPDIAKQLEGYEPRIWRPAINANGEVNMVKYEGGLPFYGQSPSSESKANCELFIKQPNKDGLDLRYDGTKLSHYLHYQFVQAVDDPLASFEEESKGLPDTVEGIILFGLGCGYHLENLLQQKKVLKLFICEPNIDHFFASLFAINWCSIFDHFDTSESRLYINLGDDGTNTFNDLVAQFYSVGPYLLNKTYVYKSYFNAALNNVIGKIREQLRVVISMGEYFDHALYGINHSLEVFAKGTSVLTANPATALTMEEKSTPVFIIGNGPSIDSSIQQIKESQDKAVVISCGTALKVLNAHGIRPDFHMEIEQNRSTYDWLSLIGDPDYLKDIVLVTCNGIHPDTHDLFKQTLIVLKEGESSTAVIESIIDKPSYALRHSYPTVGNLALDFVKTLGFVDIYLFGIDLGFIDDKKHHSEKSAYYDDKGKERYSYKDKNNTSLIVEGNFRKLVYTKFEFKVAIDVMSNCLAELTPAQTVYNTSDGAKIAGTTPLDGDSFLLSATAEAARDTVKSIKENCFVAIAGQPFVNAFETKYSHQSLQADLAKLRTIISQEVTTIEAGNALIHAQKQLLVDSYRKGNSLFFFLFHGSINFVNAALSKTVESTDTLPDAFDDIIGLWLHYCERMCDVIDSPYPRFDSSMYMRPAREKLKLSLLNKNKKALIVANSAAFNSVAKRVLDKSYSWVSDITNTPLASLSESVIAEQDYVVMLAQSAAELAVITKCLPSQTETHIVVVVAGEAALSVPSKHNFPATLLLSPLAVDDKITGAISNLSMLAELGLKCAFAEIQNVTAVPRYIIDNDFDIETLKFLQSIPDSEDVIINFFDYLMLVNKDRPINQMLMTKVGTRGRIIDHMEYEMNGATRRCTAPKFAELLAFHLDNQPDLYQT